MKNPQHPILYTFRRCPYAMRARMALYYAGITVEVREIVLRDKPAHMLKVSPKGTVPVLLLPDGTVIDESVKIMLWALKQYDPNIWLARKGLALDLISINDNDFKYALDRYKYPNRYPDENCPGFKEGMRDKGLRILKDWNASIKSQGQLTGSNISLADIAIFPFVRQFAHTDKEWFAGQDLDALQFWLEGHKNSDLFSTIMQKFNVWQDGDTPVIFGAHSVQT